VLERLAIEAGLDAAEVRSVLSSDRYAAEVRTDERDAHELGINGVPFFVLDQRLAVSGAQPAEVFFRALEQAFADRATRPASLEEGAICGPEGC
jgi:predicted DsbA family dithiol-disulfide isomerase